MIIILFFITDVFIGMLAVKIFKQHKVDFDGQERFAWYWTFYK